MTAKKKKGNSLLPFVSNVTKFFFLFALTTVLVLVQIDLVKKRTKKIKVTKHKIFA